LIATAEQRHRAAVRDNRAELLRQHHQAGRFFSGPVESSGMPIPRASATGDLANRGRTPTTQAASLSGRTV
jgi:hypothetical protein